MIKSTSKNGGNFNLKARSQDCAMRKFFRRGQRPSFQVTGSLSCCNLSIASKSRSGDGVHDFGKVAGKQPGMFRIDIFKHKQMTEY